MLRAGDSGMLEIEIQVWEGSGEEPEEFRQQRLRDEAERKRRHEQEERDIRDRFRWQAGISNNYFGPYRLALCPCCERTFLEDEVINRRRNTAYEDEESNWLFSCPDCFDHDCALMKDQWDEYYAGRL